MVTRNLIFPLSKIGIGPLSQPSTLSGAVVTWPYRIMQPVLLAILVLAGYYLGSQLGFALTPPRHAIATFWPPNAILLAALLLVPRRMWWILILAVLPAH